jgi:hypothetical protein
VQGCYTFLIEVFVHHRIFLCIRRNQTRHPILRLRLHHHMLLIQKKVLNMRYHIRYQRYKIVFSSLYRHHISLNIHSMLRILPICCELLPFHRLSIQ